MEHIYTYTKEWQSGLKDSSSFHHPRGHENVQPAVGYSSKVFRAGAVKLGHYTLGSSLVGQLTHQTAISLQGQVTLPQGGQLSGNQIYFQTRGSSYDDHAGGGGGTIDYDSQREGTPDGNGIETKVMTMDGEDRIVYVVKHSGESFSSKEKALKALQRAPARRLLRSPSTGSPRIGDVRVSFSEVACRTVSVMAKQSGFTLTPWHSSQGEGYTVEMVELGSRSAEEMVSGAQSANNIWTWVKRVFGFILCYAGFSMLTSIISTTADITLNWIPFLGPAATSIIDLGLCIANLILSISLSVIVAAVAWVFYRPVLGLTMLACAGGLLYLSSKAGEKTKTLKP